ncbi:class I SAM-dependent methyltransferase [bacterium]|nr:class I SAM-dependent methyltransferase [bacterium]
MSKQAEIDYPNTIPNHDWLESKPFCDNPTVSGKELVRFGWVLRILDLRPGSRILDVGVGSGWTSRFLGRMGHRVTGLDISPVMIEIARTQADREHIETEFQVMDMEKELPSSWHSCFDAVLFYDSLHHMENEHMVLINSFLALKPGGCLVLSEPNLLHPYTRQTKQLVRQYGVNERGYSWWSLKKALKRAGFKKVRRYANPFRRPLTLTHPLDLLEGLSFYVLELVCLSHWKTTIILKAEKGLDLFSDS